MSQIKEKSIIKIQIMVTNENKEDLLVAASPVLNLPSDIQIQIQHKCHYREKNTFRKHKYTSVLYVTVTR